MVRYVYASRTCVSWYRFEVRGDVSVVLIFSFVYYKFFSLVVFCLFVLPLFSFCFFVIFLVRPAIMF